jgi:DNA polymerase III subunit delta'
MNNNWDFLGNEWAVDMLKQHVLRGAVRHAYLFTGPPGIGRTTLALRFAQALNCPERSADGVPCGNCKTCKQIEDMKYPDLVIVEAEKTGGVLKAEQVRTLNQSLVLKPYMSDYKVILFRRFHEANPHASNALLKMLEEAPAHAILILTADNPEQLVPTVTSRCEVMRLRPLPVDMVASWVEEHGADKEKAKLLAHISGGRPGYALSLLTDDIYKESGQDSTLNFRTQKLKDLQDLLTADISTRFAYAEKLTKKKKKGKGSEESNEENEADELQEGGARVRDTLLIWLSFFRDVLMRLSGEKDAELNICNIDREVEVKMLSSRLTMSRAQRLVRDVGRSIELLDKNVNSRLLVEVMLLDWPRVKPA